MSARTVLTWGLERLRRSSWVEVGVALTLVLLGLHAAQYWFLTDDAYISFRYARNLANGYGLVFNPGFERVEGYTNFLWVLILAGLSSAGIPPEGAANVLSAALTFVLWVLVVWFVYRGAPAGALRWLLVVAPLFLAATRSVAVWTTSGLETRLFEVLVVGAVLRLIVEVERQLGGQRYRPLAGLLLALATLTRPDGLLISAVALGSAGLYLLLRGRLPWRKFALHVAAFGVLVGGHYAFRLTYYGEWFPNTYFAKVGGRSWWDMGWSYLGLFALEYAAYLWVPLIVAAVWAYRARQAGFTPLLFGVIIVPHALYVASIGGDHFEFRPLDLYFPLIFILLFEGARYVAARGRRSSIAIAIYLPVVLLGLTVLPYWSHRAFPDVYLGRFPGWKEDPQASVDFLRPEGSRVFRLPVLRELVEAYRGLLNETTSRFVGIRQEEHRLCLDSLLDEVRRLSQLVQRGVLPPDTHVATACVGAVPYYTNLRVLDQLGLTDAQVARSKPIAGPRLMAHDKYATVRYAREAGADLWAVQASHLLLGPDSVAWARLVQVAETAPLDAPVYVADLDDGYALCVVLLKGLPAASAKFPALRFRPLARADVAEQVLRRAIDTQRGALAWRPEDHRVRTLLADNLLTADRDSEAIEQYQIALPSRPADGALCRNLAVAYAKVGRVADAIVAADRGLKAAQQLFDQELVEVLERDLREYRAASPSAPAIRGWRPE